MKKCYVIFGLFLLISGAANSQITISQSDMPVPGDTVRLSTATDTVGLPNYAFTGPNYTWNYSALKAVSQTIDTFLTVAATPILYQFYFNDPIFNPTYAATVAQSVPNLPALGPVSITNVIDYFKTTSSAYENVGFGANISAIPSSTEEDSIDFVYRFPLNYGNSDSCTSKFHKSIPSLGYFGERQHRVNVVDGWGTLKTPYGTFSTLRVKTTLTTSDSLYIDTLHFGFSGPSTQQVQYKWLGAGQAEPLLQVNVSIVLGLPVITGMVYRDSVRKVLTGIAQIPTSLEGVEVFPNPTDNVIFLTSQVTLSNADIILYNIMGQAIIEKHYTKLDAGNRCDIDLHSITQGVYYLKLITAGKTFTYKVVKD